MAEEEGSGEFFPLMYLDQMNHGNLKIEYFKFLLKGTV